MASCLQDLLQHPQLWRARDARQRDLKAVATGFAPLDERLPGGGWPAQGLIEILTARAGCGEISLLLPAMLRLVTGADAWIAMVAPPHEPYAPALSAAGLDVERLLVVRAGEISGGLPKEACWALEQIVRCGACRIALGWMNTISSRALRRLQLAAEQTSTLTVIVRDERFRTTPSPAVARLLLAPARAGLEVHLLKSRGGREGRVAIEL